MKITARRILIDIRREAMRDAKRRLRTVEATLIRSAHRENRSISENDCEIRMDAILDVATASARLDEAGHGNEPRYDERSRAARELRFLRVELVAFERVRSAKTSPFEPFGSPYSPWNRMVDERILSIRESMRREGRIRDRRLRAASLAARGLPQQAA
jgi:hypothetical protein